MGDSISRQAAIDAATFSAAEWDGAYVQDLNVRIREAIKGLPPAQPEIIRCKDCKFYREYGCQRAFVYPEPEDFCSRAERRTDGRD